jgi:hypothetical protein
MSIFRTRLGFSIAMAAFTFSMANTAAAQVRPPGDVNGDGFADIMLTGPSGWSSFPVAFSHGYNGFSVVNQPAPPHPPNAKVVPGDFNGDGLADMAMTGPSAFGMIPVAFSNGNGTFHATYASGDAFSILANEQSAKALPGDFNGDGYDDIALIGPSNWTTIPIALSNGNGSFTLVNEPLAAFPSWAALPGVKVVPSDFNGDGLQDIALTGHADWDSVRIAFSNGNGTFTIANWWSVVSWFGSLPSLAATANAVPIAGDFDGDGHDDIAVTGPAGWTTIPIAFANGAASNVAVEYFPTWATTPGAKPIAGDFNGDGRDDIALTGPAGWGTIPIAFANGYGTFTLANWSAPDFAGWASTPGAIPLAGY